MRCDQTQAAERIGGPPGRVHAMGVCGVGVAAVAALLVRRGWLVSGCDPAAGAMAEWLRGQGVTVSDHHDPAHVADCDLLVCSAAVGGDHAEIQQALAFGVPVMARGEALAALVDDYRGVAVCGTHGKTTTSCFTTRLLQELGEDPSWCIGGQTVTLGGVFGHGSGKLLVVEADESDGTLARYRPAVTVLTNIDLDHMEHFGDEVALLACFEAVVRQTCEALVYGVDDARACAAARAAGGAVVGFGFGCEADLRAGAVQLNPADVQFELWWRGARLGTVRLGVPGRHNLLNALAAAGAALALGHDPARVVEALPRVVELPARRFECVASRAGMRVISDYAHHPAEIAALVSAARLQGARRLLAVFQPHRYTRTRALGPEFPAAFRGVDELVLLPVYAASESPVAGGTSADLYGWFREAGVTPAPLLAASLEMAWGYLRRQLRDGDLLLIVGAGDVVRLAGWAATAFETGTVGGAAPVCLQGSDRGRQALGLDLAGLDGLVVEADAPVGRQTGYGVGGRADWLVAVQTEAALGSLLRWAGAARLPWAMLGAGMNTLVSDLGVPGAVIGLVGTEFRGLSRQDGQVTVGCGWSGPALLDRLEREGAGGLEFLEGIPGQVGGWLAMNAGAHGCEVGSWVVRIRCLNSDGTPAIVPASQAGFGYRRCEGLSGRVAVSVDLRVQQTAPEEIRLKRKAFRDRRLALAGLRTAGSVFRNPPDEAAGRILEAAGCKGLRVGGAEVLARHANVIAVGATGTASDVRALIEQMRQRAGQMGGVVLQPEVRFLGEG